MGLDMNLYREMVLTDCMELKGDKGDKVGKVLCEDKRFLTNESVCYWRKFNALHKYFADNFNRQQDDNCVDMYLDIDDIKELLEKLKALRKKIKMGKGFVTTYYSMVNQNHLKGCKVGDEVLAILKKTEPSRCIENDIKSAVITKVFGDNFDVDFRIDGEVVLNPEVCEKELPTTSGFFFGSTDYDQWYVNDIDSSIEQLTEVVDSHNKLIEAGVSPYDIDYYYRASY